MAVRDPYAANQADLLGEGTADPAAAPAAPPAAPVDPYAAARAKLSSSATTTANINANQDRTSGTGAPLAAGGGATGAYDAANDSGKAQFDYMHQLGSPGGISSVKDLFNREGEGVGVSHAGDAVNAGGFSIQNPLDFNPIKGITDPNTGLGTTVGGVGGAVGGKPVTNLSPGTRDAAGLAGNGVLSTTAGGVGDALTQAMGGNGSPNFDTSGADRGGMGLGGAYSDTLGNAQAQGANMQAMGQGVLNGTTAPGGQGAQGQQDALSAAMNFQKGPRQASGVVGDVNKFMKAPQAPSAAEIQLKQGAQGNMADALALARSGRARDAGSQARNLNVAQAQNSATGVDTARDTALLRAKETTDQKAQQLQALGLKGNLAQGLDQGTLSALGLQGDIANQIRGNNTAERGQSLSYDQGQNQIGAGLTSDVLKTIPQLETIRHADQFDLTPQQKLEQAKIGNPTKTTADYVTALLGDTLSAL